MIITMILFVVQLLLGVYLLLPALNPLSSGLWLFIIIEVLIFTGVCKFCADISFSDIADTVYPFAFFVGIVLFSVLLILATISSPIFASKKLASVANIENGVLDDIPSIDDISKIPLMDTESASIAGQRALGGLDDLVSQYVISQNYTQCVINGKPMKIAPLEYSGFFKWVRNKNSGIPGYIIVDPATYKAEFVRLENGFKYSPSAYFSKDLKRHLRKEYPSKIFGDIYFEVDDDGTPYWVAPVLYSTSLFNCKDLESVIIVNAVNGETKEYNTKSVPKWVDVVFNGDFIETIANYNLVYKNGFLNTITSASGCKQLTDDFGYVVIDDHLFVYSGVTSLASDSSNLGILLSDCRSGEMKYIQAPGADELSAMKAAEGELQQYGYIASFPSLIRVDDTLKYVLVLKDVNGIVKKYAVVDLLNYSNVNCGDTLKDAMNGLVKKEKSSSSSSTTIKIEEINFINVDNVTYVYIKDDTGNVYKTDFSEKWVLANIGDFIEVETKYVNENKIIVF